MALYFLYVGQLAYNRFQVWRKHKAIEIHYPELSERGKWDFVSTWSKLSLQFCVLTDCRKNLKEVGWNFGMGIRGLAN